MIEFIDLKRQQALIKSNIDAGIQRVLSHGDRKSTRLNSSHT